jgi:N-acetyl-anhydromuramyl-L-alanine amidase AmpD
VGYHYLVRADGTVEKGRPDDKQGAHVLGYNDKSLGIAVAGNFVSESPPEAQLASLVRLINGLKMEYPAAQVVRHRDLQGTDCPGDAFPWDEFRVRLKRYGEEQAAGRAPRAEDWKVQIVQNARAWNLITQDHDPDEPAPKWFVLAVALNTLKVVKSK